jgi:adenosine deaminase
MLQNLDYLSLKKMVRASLEHSFLPGISIWKISGRYDRVTDDCASDELGDPYPSDTCVKLISTSERAAMQWKLEAQLNAFEDATVQQP